MYSTLDRYAHVGCLAWQWAVRESETGVLGRGLCPIMEKPPTSPLHPAHTQTASHVTRLAQHTHAGDTPTHRQAVGSAPTVGGTSVNPCCRPLPKGGSLILLLDPSLSSDHTPRLPQVP